MSKKVYDEALWALYEPAEVVITIKGNRDLPDIKKHVYARFDGILANLAHVTRVKLNLVSDEYRPYQEDLYHNHERLVARLNAFLDTIQHGRTLRSFEIYVDESCIGGQNAGCRLFDIIQQRFQARPKKESCAFKVYLGAIDETSATGITKGRLDELVGVCGG